MMRNIVSSTIEDIELALDELGLPGKVTSWSQNWYASVVE